MDYNSTNMDLNTINSKYNQSEVAIPTIIASIILVVWLFLVLIIKLMTKSAESLLNHNKYDLILFKDLNKQNYQKNSGVVGRRLFDNSQVIQHNIKALNDSNFDINSLNNKFSVMYARKRGGKLIK
jgi:hypothetical protein